jgi:hypothetical protein
VAHLRQSALGFSAIVESLERRELLSAVSLGVSAPGVAIAGSPFLIKITALDQSGNPVTNYNGSVNLTSSDGQTVFVSAADITLNNGTATVAVTLNTPNAVTLTAASGTLTGTSASVTVTPPVSSFTVSAAQTQVTAGSPFSVTVRAVDQYGNIVSGYNGPVTLTSSDGQAVTVTGGASLNGGMGLFRSLWTRSTPSRSRPIRALFRAPAAPSK